MCIRDSTITDFNGCTDNITVQIDQPNELVTSTLSIDSTSCFGYNNGSAEVDATGGTHPYTYEWSNSQTGSILSNVGAGTYSCFISDVNECQQIESVTIEQPNIVDGIIQQDSVSCHQGSDGGLDLTPSGGTLPYTYNWNNGSTTVSYTHLTLPTTPYV